jgi:hypothetical protein
MFQLNPVLTTNAAGTFSVTLDGLMQGNAHDDPAMRNQLTGGLLDAAETLPMWGGIPVGEYLRITAMDNAIRATVKRSTTAATTSGISVFNQNHTMINTPQCNVPQSSPGMAVNFYRLGSLARIPMQADPALIAALPSTMPSATPLNWDPAAGWVTLATGGSGGWALPTTLKILGWNSGNSMVVVYTSSGANAGATNWSRAGSAVLLLI